ncbi:NAD(P)/FAD-dependent oxidoreductase [Pontibacter ruber]|uniref:NAD(P)/FAD-dependent oxidoreductase n=1 Tax=Pontibacter ruber TaxID=1343895 RepID=A0ABW5CV52_9BACT|nr:FAD-dependent oxidoreductase [Pontibacter ruber]
MQQDRHLVIIGNGIAGITLAQHVRRHSSMRITIISAESAVHFSRTALMYVYMGHMRLQDITPYEDWYWREHNLELVHDYVEQIDFGQKLLHLRQGQPLKYDTLVLATGSVPAFFNWPGQQLKGVQGLNSLQDLELMQQQTQGINRAVVVGGGLIGIEMAEMLQSRGIAVTMLVREKLNWQNILPWEEALLVSRHLQAHGIELLLEDELEEILQDEQGNARAVRTIKGKEIACQFVGIATGVLPNVAFLQNSVLELDRGILVNEYFETSIADVYAIGDCAQFRNPTPPAPAVEQLWYTGRQHGETLASTLLGTRTAYDRGPWFNSAKFMDIEYQTYGYVPNQLPPELDSLYWQHKSGRKAIRLVYERNTQKLTGLNLLGVRYRHDLCHHWLRQGYTLKEALAELPAANFDPEFFRKFEHEIMAQYQQRFPDQPLPEKQQQNNWWNLRSKFKLATGSKKH